LYEQCSRTALDKLKSTNEITIETTNRYSLITVTNWEEYQTLSEIQANKKAKYSANKCQTDDKQMTNKRQQRKNDKKYTSYIKEEKKAAAPQEVFPPGLSRSINFH